MRPSSWLLAFLLILPCAIGELIACTNDKDGWYANDGYCYKFMEDSKIRRSWQQAEEYCVTQLKSHLLSIASKKENDFVQGVMEAGDLIIYPSAWIGLKASGLGGSFKWSDGLPSDYGNWKGNGSIPIPDNRTSCVAVVQGGKWGAIDCNTALRGFICKTAEQVTESTTSSPPTTLSPALSDCGPEFKNWTRYNDFCYYIPTRASETLDWHYANEYCNAHGAHLASLHSEEEDLFIAEMVGKKNTYNFYWIGLSATGGEKFEWVDETILDYDAMKNDTHKAIATDNKCVHIYVYPSGRRAWFFGQCDAKKGYLCKKRYGIAPSTITPKPTTYAPGWCQDGWTRIGNKCVKLMGTDIPLNFTEALSACRNIGEKGNLVSIENQKEQDTVTTLLLDQIGEIYIGLRKNGYYKFKWVDGSRFKFQNWGAGEPSNAGNENSCTKIQSMKAQAGKWRTDSNSCVKKLSYICQVFPSISAVTSPLPPTECKEGFEKFSQSCFKLFAGKEKKNWKEAENVCQRSGGHLATINSGLEQSFINTRLYSLNDQVDSFWIGLSEEKRVFTWIDKWPIYYTNWGEFQPEVSKATKRCAYLDVATRQWNATSCEDERNFICEITNEKPPVVPVIKNKVCPPRVENEKTDKNWIDPGTSSDYCYYVEAGETDATMENWSNASYLCLQNSAELTSFHSQHEIDILGPKIKDAKKSLWIGLTLKSHGEYGWSDNSPMDFEVWAKDEPIKDAYNPCVALMPSTGQWEVKTCNNLLGYVCRVQKVQGNETNTDDDPSTSGSKSGLSGGGIAGLVIFLIIAVIGITGGVYFYMKRRGNVPQSRGKLF